jgi:glycine/D-amino acid oxidase-like deaminating enzyme
MAQKFYTQALCLGGGAAGWFTADELVSRGISCAIIDTPRPGGYASTRNQGWLQSGSLYLSSDSTTEDTAKHCQQGYMEIISRYRDVVRNQDCNFLYRHRERRDQDIARYREYGIEAIPLSSRDIEEPLLRGGRLYHAIRVPDHPFDSSRLLQHVADQACQDGADFYPVASLENIVPNWDGPYLHLFIDDNREIVCHAVVLTCGAYIPEMLEKLLPGQVHGFKRSKHPVLVLRGETTLARSMLITMHEVDGLHLVPFDIAEGNGVSICFSKMGEDITSARDFALPIGWEKHFASSLPDLLPGIKTLVTENTLLAHVYTCQKLFLEKDPSNRSPFCLSFAPDASSLENVLVVYPGKLTCASVLAQMCANKVEQLLERFPSFTNVGQSMPAPVVAKQRYCDKPQYRLILYNNELCFESIT